jgi:hypothetical protein
LEIAAARLRLCLAGRGGHARRGAYAGGEAEKIALLDIHEFRPRFLVCAYRDLASRERQRQGSEILRKCKST